MVTKTAGLEIGRKTFGDFDLELRAHVAVGDFLGFMEHRDVAGGIVLYRQGDAADEIDLVASGRLVIDLLGNGGQTLRVRNITTHSVIGEMGFFRRVSRSATVSAEGPVNLFTLRREQFDRMPSPPARSMNSACAFAVCVFAHSETVCHRTDHRSERD